MLPHPSTNTFGAMVSSWNDVLTARHGAHCDITDATMQATSLEGAWARHLGRSLAVFQVGESGDGGRLLAAATPQPEEFRSALSLFVQEEQEHARLLSVLLRAMGHPLRQSHWTDSVFIRVRRLMSLRTELLVLLVAEIIGGEYYRVVSDTVPDEAVAGVLHRIADDEAVHLSFHVDTLRGLCAAWSASTNRLVRSVWTILLTGASIVVALGHRRVLTLAGVTVREFVRKVATTGVETGRAMWTCRPEDHKPTEADNPALSFRHIAILANDATT
jgi:hypothetical protein